MSIKSREYLDNAVRSLQIADHMTYVTYPLFNEKKLLLKIFDEINKCIINCIFYVVSLDNVTGDVRNMNYALRLFLDRKTENLGLSNEQVKKIKEILELNQRHKESAMEFVRRDKVVIMSDSLSVEAIDLKKIKDYLIVAKDLMSGLGVG